MRNKNTVFFRGKVEVLANFSAEEISSDGSIILLEKLERKHKLIDYYSKLIPDNRNPLRIVHSIKKMLKQRTFMLIHGYEDCNDVDYLKTDPLYKDILGGQMASQPTLSRLENSLDKASIFDICYAWIDKYVESLKGRKEIIIDIDCTDDPTYGRQQLSLFNGFYGQFMYNELFFHDGHTGQIILPVLRPGNSHSNKWYVSILKRIVSRIRDTYPALEIIIRGDSGFSCPAFYLLAKQYELKYALGQSSNEVLKRKVRRAYTAVEHLYLKKGQKHQHFIEHQYKSGTWEESQKCISKVESTGRGMNVRHIISNIEGASRDVYFGFYVKRGEASENRIKEVKNMCYSDRLSTHGFWSNFFRLLLSSLAYEFVLLLKDLIKRTTFKDAKRWQVDSIRTRLLKIGATIKKTKRRIYYRLSKSFVHQELFIALLRQK